jgi:hypothetical protein
MQQRMLTQDALFERFREIIATDPRIDANTKTKFDGKQLAIVPMRKYFRKQLLNGASGKVELIKSNDDKLYGVRNFDKDKLNASEYMLVGSIVIKYGLSLTDANPKTAIYSNLIWAIDNVGADATDQDAGTAGIQSYPVPIQRVPSDLLSSEISFTIASDIILPNFPMNTFFIDSNVSQNTMADFGNGYLLPIPKLIPANTAFQFELTVADSEAIDPIVAGNYQYLDITLEGIGFAVKS